MNENIFLFTDRKSCFGGSFLLYKDKKCAYEKGNFG